MKIKSIHLYSHQGKRRDLEFNVNGLNIITGRSSTGKSSLSEIIEYCMGRSTFIVSDGVIRDKVAWYAVIYQFKGMQVFIAKPTPPKGGTSCSTAMQRVGNDLSVPNFSELVENSNDSAVESLLSRLLGIPENRTNVDINSSRVSFNTNIKHTFYYLFQKQTLVANREQLFYRQNEEFQPQTIKDTLPILLGVYPDEKYELEYKLRNLKRELRLKNKLLLQSKDDIDSSYLTAVNLLSEAKAVGIVQNDNDAVTVENIFVQLSKVLDWRPEQLKKDDDARVSIR